MARRDIAVIGTSAGGVEALKRLVIGLPPDFPGSLFVVVHTNPLGTSALPEILSRAGCLEARHPVDGEAIEPATIYVAPPDRHLLLERDAVRVLRGPKENRHRPAVDPLFRTAALAYGTRVAGVVLTGSLDDGTAGLQAVKNRGGIAIVQEPDEAPFPEMPRSALRNVEVDHCVSVAEIAPLLTLLAKDPVAPPDPVPAHESLEIESRIALREDATMDDVSKLGAPSTLTCPECHGSLWQVDDGDLLRFRCHVGHAFSAESLAAEEFGALEDAVWAALRSFEENAELSRRMAHIARGRADVSGARRYDARADRWQEHARVLRTLLVRENAPARE